MGEYVPSSPSASENTSISDMVNMDELNTAAKLLLNTAVGDYHPTYGIGSMSCSIYDTAWVSMVTKTGLDGETRWLFPKCFYYLLDSQAEDGSWGLSTTQSSPRVVPVSQQIDGILSTAASLLSLLRHQAAPLQINHSNITELESMDLHNRTAKSLSSLCAQLQVWDVASTVHVGFEVIVPALLNLLAKELDPPMAEELQKSLSGPAFEELMTINSNKMSRFRPECLYGNVRSTVLHSLEAFTDHGGVDFDGLTHHLTLGSMMGSPSSTAAYLMEASRWDDEAEAYLKHVLQHGPGRGSGAVPSAYPSTYFEFSWVLSTLFTSGFPPTNLESPALSKMVKVLSEGLKNEGGIIGFAPYFLADVDDTAKAITCLRMLGKDADPTRMVEAFEAETHFKTYPSERDPSFSANCNALLALLHQSDPRQFAEQINKALVFLIEYWWNAVDRIKDKWNLSHLYPTLLFVDALVTLVDLMESGDLPMFRDETLRSKTAVCLYQACYRTLLEQNDNNGSWNDSLEETAYGTMILSQALRLVFFQEFNVDEKLRSAIHRAVTFIQLVSSTSGDESTYRITTTQPDQQHLWVEKVGYSSPVLLEAYRLAALGRATISLSSHQQDNPNSNKKVGSSLLEDTSAVPKLAHLLHRTPLFSQTNTPEWEIRASMVEGTLFRPLIRALRLSVFTRQGVEEDTYFDVIPLAWPSCNNRTRIFAPSCFLFEGMMAAMLNYQVDEFMEAVAGVHYAEDIPELRAMIDEVVACTSHESEEMAAALALGCCHHDNNNGLKIGGGDMKFPSNGDKSKPHFASHGTATTTGISTNNKSTTIDETKRKQVLIPLQKFVRRALHHPAILKSSPHDRKNMTIELRIYLQTHVTQAEDNILLQRGQFHSAGVMQRETFFRWVRTTSADHTSAPYTFMFVSCLLGSWFTTKDGGEIRDCFATPVEKYLASAMCQSLAAMCRMYNDYGSVVRDRDEGNLNSVDFCEFDTHHHLATTSNGAIQENGDDEAIIQRKKDDLFEIAQYERACTEEAFKRLCEIPTVSEEERARKKRKMDLYRLFYNVTDLWGQMYVLRDLGSRLTVNGNGNT